MLHNNGNDYAIYPIKMVSYGARYAKDILHAISVQRVRNDNQTINLAPGMYDWKNCCTIHDSYKEYQCHYNTEIYLINLAAVAVLKTKLGFI